MRVESYQDLKTWQLAMDIAVDCYRLTREFPREELFGLTSQIRRASSSMAANIAEGYGRESTKDYVRFLQIAQGSLKETETHLLLSIRVTLCPEQGASSVLKKCELLGRMLHGQIRALQERVESK